MVIGYAYIVLMMLLFLVAVPFMAWSLWNACRYAHLKRRYEKNMGINSVHVLGKVPSKKYKTKKGA